jgi:hypothetical protein
MANAPQGSDQEAHRPAAPKFEAAKFPWEADTDATIMANLAIGNLREALQAWLRSERGVHAETLMVVVGALAGFTAQNAAFRSLGPPGQPVPKGALMMAEAGGKKYYFGDLLNGYLVRQAGGSKYPLWGYIAAAALQAGMPQADLPDVAEMFEHTAKTVGTEDFGIPRAPAGISPHLTPRKALELFWPSVKALLGSTQGPMPEPKSVAEEHWPLVVALVARQFILMAKDTLQPQVALRLIMESAIAMSKIDPNTVPQTAPLTS